MTDALKNALAIVPAVSLVAGGVSGGDFDVALFVIGLMYLTWCVVSSAGIGAAWLFEKVKHREIGDNGFFWIFYGAALCAIALAIAVPSIDEGFFSDKANDFGTLHIMGIVVTVIAAISVGIRFSPSAPKRTHACPDCAESISVSAHKCKHCGYRLSQPEVPSAEPA